MTKLEEEIRSAINRHLRENIYNKPDYILSGYLLSCLEAFEMASQQRDAWYGRDPRPGGKG